MNVSEVNCSTITLQWGAVDCIHRNGDITGYSVRYGVQGSGSTQTVNVSGGGSTQTIISGLTPSTNYSINVAAVNSIGTGVYSNYVLFQLTQEGTITYNVLLKLSALRLEQRCPCTQRRLQIMQLTDRFYQRNNSQIHTTLYRYKYRHPIHTRTMHRITMTMTMTNTHHYITPLPP